MCCAKIINFHTFLMHINIFYFEFLLFFLNIVTASKGKILHIVYLFFIDSLR